MADDSTAKVGQDEIERLLQQAKAGAAPKPAAPKPQEESASLSQDEIEALLSGDGPSPESAPPEPDTNPPTPSVAPVAAPQVTTSPGPTSGETNVLKDDIDVLFHHAEEALASINDPSEVVPSGIAPFELADFAGARPSSDQATLELIGDVQLDLKIELGRAHMHLEDVLKLVKGSVVPLDKLAGDPVDIFVNGRLIAHGEVLVLNDNFCVRIAELVSGDAPD